MSKIKLILLIAGATLFMGAATAYAIEFIWRVDRFKLETGHSESFNVIKTNKAFKVKGKVGGENVEFECKAISPANLNIQTQIEGGEPGKGVEELEFGQCAPLLPVGCNQIMVSPWSRKDIEVVESEAGGKKEILFQPRFTFRMRGLECSVCLNVSGSVVAELTPENDETAKKVIKFPAASQKYRNSKGEVKEAPGLKDQNGEKASMEGEAEVELISKEEFGIT